MKIKSISLALFTANIEKQGFSYNKEASDMDSTKSVYYKNPKEGFSYFKEDAWQDIIKYTYKNRKGLEYRIYAIDDDVISIYYKQSGYKFYNQVIIDLRKNYWKQFVK